MEKLELEVGQPLPGFVHLGHTIAFSVADFEFPVTGTDPKNDLQICTMDGIKLAKCLAAKMVLVPALAALMQQAMAIYIDSMRDPEIREIINQQNTDNGKG